MKFCKDGRIWGQNNKLAGFHLGKLCIYVKKYNKMGEWNNHPNIAKNQHKKGLCYGKLNKNWKGGITPLNDAIRRMDESIEWRKKVFTRDNYICQKCGISGRKLHSHHIKPFTKILDEFLKLYSRFSPIDDRETLIKLAMDYEPFWNLANGKTLCFLCHNKVKKILLTKVLLDNELSNIENII